MSAPAEAWVPDIDFAARLSLVRNKLAWNQKEAALACGFSQSSWRHWESGARPHAYLEVCEKIADRTGVSLAWLVGLPTGEQDRPLIRRYADGSAHAA